MKHHYKVDIRWSDEDQVWIATVPELEGVVTHGDTVVEAATMADEAIQLHLESLQAHNEEIPEPAALKKLSGDYPLRMGRERHQEVYIRANKMGVSLNEYLTKLIDRDVDQDFSKVIFKGNSARLKEKLRKYKAKKKKVDKDHPIFSKGKKPSHHKRGSSKKA